MSEQSSDSTTDTSSGQAPPEGDGQNRNPEQQPKTFDAEYVANLRKEAAKYRTEAKANAEAAKQLSALEDSMKSDTEKAMDRITKAEAEVAKVPARVAEALKSHLVAIHKINDEDAELFLTASDPEVLIKQVGRLTQRQADAEATRRAEAEAAEAEAKRRGNHVPREGTPTTASEDQDLAFTREFFGG